MSLQVALKNLISDGRDIVTSIRFPKHVKRELAVLFVASDKELEESVDIFGGLCRGGSLGSALGIRETNIDRLNRG